MYRNVLMVCVVTLLSAIPSLGGGPKEDLAKLKGDWTLVYTEIDGKKRTPEDFKEFSRAITGDTFLVTIETEEGVHTVGGKFKLDLSKSPRTIDVEMTEGQSKGKSFHGIYKLEGDTQTICLTTSDKDRPTKFDSKEGTVTVWKRPKAAAKEKKT